MKPLKKLLLLFFILAASGCSGKNETDTAPVALTLVKEVSVTTDSEGGSARSEVIAGMMEKGTIGEESQYVPLRSTIRNPKSARINPSPL